MQPDDLISNAMQAGGGMLDGKTFFAVEGNIERNLLRVKPLHQLYIDNYLAFHWDIRHDFILMGIFNTEEAAEEYITFIRTLNKDEEGNRIP